MLMLEGYTLNFTCSKIQPLEGQYDWWNKISWIKTHLTEPKRFKMMSNFKMSKKSGTSKSGSASAGNRKLYHKGAAWSLAKSSPLSHWQKSPLKTVVSTHHGAIAALIISPVGPRHPTTTGGPVGSSQNLLLLMDGAVPLVNESLTWTRAAIAPLCVDTTVFRGLFCQWPDIEWWCCRTIVEGRHSSHSGRDATQRRWLGQTRSSSFVIQFTISGWCTAASSGFALLWHFKFAHHLETFWFN